MTGGSLEGESFDRLTVSSLQTWAQQGRVNAQYGCNIAHGTSKNIARSLHCIIYAYTHNFMTNLFSQ